MSATVAEDPHAEGATGPGAMTGCLAPIDKGGLDELIAKGRANPQAIKTLKCKTIAEGRSATST